MWSNPPYNFDNLGMALVSLFVTATLNGYAGGCLASLPSGGAECFAVRDRSALGWCVGVGASIDTCAAANRRPLPPKTQRSWMTPWPPLRTLACSPCP